MSDTTLDPVRKPFAKGPSSSVRNNYNKGKKPRKVESVLCARKAAIKPVRLKGVEDARKLFTRGKIFFVFFSWAY